jgi:hypothetical protein
LNIGLGFALKQFGRESGWATSSVAGWAAPTGKIVVQAIVSKTAISVIEQSPCGFHL